MDISALETGNFQLGNIDVICHLASARPAHPSSQLAESLTFTQKIINAAIKNQIPGFINASSQSVYGTGRAPLSEEMPPAPETAYAQTTWASEVMAASLTALSRTSRATSLRLPRLIGPGPGWRIDEVAHKYVAASIRGEKLKVWGGKQKLDLIDVRDASRLVAKLVVAPYSKWPAALNVSTGKPVSVLELAQRVMALAATGTGASEQVEIDESFIAPSFGMDNSRATRLFDWGSVYTLEETLAGIAGELKKQRKEGKPYEAKTG
ncbi:MAG: NAD(P)-dependent oxidoreductase [Nitrosospira sp.]|nr:NAD(P)-dependent oxidoreductase [Nitrosospira sp.]